MADSYDLAIVGAGSAAFAAAIRARQQGLSVVMVERGQIGGTCVNVGCVPSKALLAAAESRNIALESKFPGITVDAADVNMSALVEGKDELVSDLRRDKYIDLADEHGFQIVDGTARFTGTPHDPQLHVDGHDIAAEHYLIVTGAQAWTPPIDGLDDVPYLTSTTAFELAKLPRSLVVVGGNYVGLEVAQLFAHLGTDVTIVEALDRLAPLEEPEASAAIERVFNDDGIDVRTGAAVKGVARDRDGVMADVGGDRISAEHLLMATGRRPQSDQLGLDHVGVRVGPRGEVTVDEHLRTGNPRIWAAGDVIGQPQFVYVAAAHGTLAVDNAFAGADRVVDYRTVPRVTFTTPAIAGVGMTEAQTHEEGLDCECRVIPLDYVPRAIVNRDTRGVAKIVADRDGGVVRGITVVGDNAGDTMLAGVYALEAGMTTKQLANLWCPYLTMAEAIKIAAQAFHTDITKLSCCAA